MIIAAAVLVAVACVAASLRRLFLAAVPSALDAPTLVEALRRAAPAGEDAKGCVRRALASSPEESLERSFAGALGEGPALRVALVNECLREWDHAAQRWARVPRVAASIATTACFLLAAAQLRSGLAEASAIEDEARSVALDAAILHAVDVVAVGLAAAAMCIAVQMRARRLARRAVDAVDALVERLEIV